MSQAPATATVPERLRLATAALAGCSGCHMALLDLHLELLELASHLVDRLVELLHPLLQPRIGLGTAGGGSGQGAHPIGRHHRPQALAEPQGPERAALAAPIGFREQPPAQTGGPEHGPAEGREQQAATGAAGPVAAIGPGVSPGISHDRRETTRSP